MNRVVATGLIALSQILLIGVAIAPQASARLTGETYVVRVGPLDPIDPYRGAYVALDYPDLHARESESDRGPVYITLRHEGEVWVADDFLRTRPDGGPYLACMDDGWQVHCGIESYFLPQDSARAMEMNLSDGAFAELKVDSRGHAALLHVRATID